MPPPAHVCHECKYFLVLDADHPHPPEQGICCFDPPFIMSFPGTKTYLGETIVDQYSGRPPVHGAGTPCHNFVLA